MRMKKTGILAGIMATCICIAQSVPAFGAQQDLVGFVPSAGKPDGNAGKELSYRRECSREHWTSETCCRNDGK